MSSIKEMEYYQFGYHEGVKEGRRKGFDEGVDALRKVVKLFLKYNPGYANIEQRLNNDKLQLLLNEYNVWPAWVDLYRLQLADEAQKTNGCG